MVGKLFRVSLGMRSWQLTWMKVDNPFKLFLCQTVAGSSEYRFRVHHRNTSSGGSRHIGVAITVTVRSSGRNWRLQSPCILSITIGRDKQLLVKN